MSLIFISQISSNDGVQVQKEGPCGMPSQLLTEVKSMLKPLVVKCPRFSDPTFFGSVVNCCVQTNTTCLNMSNWSTQILYDSLMFFYVSLC